LEHEGHGKNRDTEKSNVMIFPVFFRVPVFAVSFVFQGAT